MRIRLPVLVAAFALVLAVAACGSDDTTTVTEPAGAETRGSESPQSDATGPATTEADVAQSDAAASDAAEDPSGGAAAGDSTVDSAVADDGDAASPALAGPGDVPDLQMINMHTDEAISLQSVVDGQTPLLFWFWAPH